MYFSLTISVYENKTQTQNLSFSIHSMLFMIKQADCHNKRRHPKKLRELDERLTSRLNSNVLADISLLTSNESSILRRRLNRKNKIDDDFLE